LRGDALRRARSSTDRWRRIRFDADRLLTRIRFLLPMRGMADFDGSRASMPSFYGAARKYRRYAPHRSRFTHQE
jgi:hypothetical protein